jgi:hypothetical protein
VLAGLPRLGPQVSALFAAVVRAALDHERNPNIRPVTRRAAALCWAAVWSGSDARGFVHERIVKRRGVPRQRLRSGDVARLDVDSAANHTFGPDAANVAVSGAFGGWPIRASVC